MKSRVIFLLLVVSYLIFGQKAETQKIAQKRVVMVIAQRDFRDEELKVPMDFLLSKNIKVEVASTDTIEAVGMLGMQIKPTMRIGAINPKDFSGIIFVGGIGVMKLWTDTLLYRIANDFYNEKKVIGAICLAPVILARAGLLKGLKATVYPSGRDELVKARALCSKADIEVSGRIITASGPPAAKKFASAFYNKLMK